jgi:hypothetical protein
MMKLQRGELGAARERFSRHLATLLEVAGFVKTEEKAEENVEGEDA